MMLLLFSGSVKSDSLPPHGLQHTRLPCPSPSSRVCPNSCPLSRDAIQPSHPLSSPSPPSFDLPCLRGLFQWIISLNQVARVLELQLQQQSFQWIFRFEMYPWLINLWFWYHVKNVIAPGNYLCYLLTLFSPFQLSQPLQIFQAFSSSLCGFVPPSHFCPLASPLFPHCLPASFKVLCLSYSFFTCKEFLKG